MIKGQQKRVYGVFLVTGKWGLTTSLKEAQQAIKQYGGEIRAVSWWHHKDATRVRRGEVGGGWDAPTFRIVSDHVESKEKP